MKAIPPPLGHPPPPIRLLVKPIEIRPSTSGTFGRPNTGNRPLTGNTDRPDTGISERPDKGSGFRSNRPAPLNLHGRLRRLTDADEDREFGEEEHNLSVLRNSIPVFGIIDHEDDSQHDSGFADQGVTHLGTSEKAINLSPDTPSSTELPLDLPDANLVYDPKDSFGSMGKQSNVSYLSDFRRRTDEPLSDWRSEFLSSMLDSAKLFRGSPQTQIPSSAALPGIVSAGPRTVSGDKEDGLLEYKFNETLEDLEETPRGVGRGVKIVRSLSLSSNAGDQSFGRSISSSLSSYLSGDIKESVFLDKIPILSNDVATRTTPSEEMLRPHVSSFEQMAHSSGRTFSRSPQSPDGYLPLHSNTPLPKWPIDDLTSSTTPAAFPDGMQLLMHLKKRLEIATAAKQRLEHEIEVNSKTAKDELCKLRRIIDGFQEENTMLRSRLAKVASLA